MLWWISGTPCLLMFAATRDIILIGMPRVGGADPLHPLNILLIHGHFETISRSIAGVYRNGVENNAETFQDILFSSEDALWPKDSYDVMRVIVLFHW